METDNYGLFNSALPVSPILHRGNGRTRGDDPRLLDTRRVPRTFFKMSRSPSRAWLGQASPLYNALVGNLFAALGLMRGRCLIVAGLITALPLIRSARADGFASWTLRSSQTTNDLFCAAFGNGVLVAAGDQGTIVTSADGTNWTAQSSGTASGLFSVRFLNGGFCVVGRDGTILTSTNGITWNLPASGVSDLLSDVAYGNGTYVAVGQASGAGAILTSTDSVNWTAQDSGTKGSMYSVIFRNGQFLATVFLDSSIQASYLTSSPDGVNWTDYPSTKVLLVSLAAGPTNLVAVGDDPAGGWTYPLLSSPEGNKWTRHTGGGASQLVGIAYNQEFVAVGDFGLILTSPDGNGWTKRAAPTRHFLQSIAFTTQTAIIVGDLGTILQSGPLTPSAPVLTGADRMNGYWITLSGDPGAQYRVQVSADLASWADLGFLGDRQGGAFLLDANAVQARWRFYRAVWP